MSMLDDVKQGLAALPTHLHGGLLRYIEDGIEPGGFLRAVIENDLLEAVGRAGKSIGLDELRRLTQFFYTDCPAFSWGNREKRLAWQEQGGLAGKERAIEERLRA